MPCNQVTCNAERWSGAPTLFWGHRFRNAGSELTDTIMAMATDDDAALLFPIGHCIGAYYDLPVSTDHFFQVRVGPDVIRLTDEQFAIWGLAHGVPDRAPDQPWTRQTVLTAARRAGIAQAEEVLDSLVKDYLLVETTPGTDSAVDFARRHRLIPRTGWPGHHRPRSPNWFGRNCPPRTRRGAGPCRCALRHWCARGAEWTARATG